MDQGNDNDDRHWVKNLKPPYIPDFPSIKTLAANAYIKKVTTCTDGGYDITLSLSENDIAVAQELMLIKKNNGCVACAFQEISDKP